MNRIVLIGNGFDLAHKLPTRYEDFINWYWEQRVMGFCGNFSDTDADCLCSFKIKNKDVCSVWNVFAYYYCSKLTNPVSSKVIIDSIINNPLNYETTFSPFLKNIYNSIETKGWVDIENEYYLLLRKCSLDSNPCSLSVKELNEQLRYLQNKLIQYLTSLTTNDIAFNKDIKKIIYSPISFNDISVAGKSCITDHCNYWLSRDKQEWSNLLSQYGISDYPIIENISKFKSKYVSQTSDGNIVVKDYDACPREVLLPNCIMLLNFNYTLVADRYAVNTITFTNHIHGDLSNPQNIIFGYGDELDEGYGNFLSLNNNDYLQYIKSIKYLESSNYRNMLYFIEAAPYQIFIMGHSCGKSDRTLLNTLFEHKNCVSIKPFYYKKNDITDNYLEIVQNICRNFTDMKLMRDRVVNKTYCEPLPQKVVTDLKTNK